MKIEPFRLERYFAEYEFKAKHLLSCSDAESMTLDALLDFEPKLRESLGQTWLGYSDSAGIPEVREEIAKTYGSMRAGEILLHTGAEEPIFNLMNSTLSAGDHVIAHFPGYQSIYSVPRALGCEVSLWKAHFEAGWSLDLDELERELRPNTKLVIVNFPHNPTGFIPSLDWQKSLIEILRKRGILLLSDEVYRGLEFPASRRLPAACDLYENAISLGVVSKAYGLAGLRVGWIATKNREAYARLAAFKDYTTICNPILSEKLAMIAIRHREKIIARNAVIVLENLAKLDGFISKNAERFEWIRPVGGTMAFPRAKNGFDMEKFSKRFLDEKSVMLISGKYFDMGSEYFRLGLGRANFSQVFSIFEEEIRKS